MRQGAFLKSCASENINWYNLSIQANPAAVLDPPPQDHLNHSSIAGSHADYWFFCISFGLTSATYHQGESTECQQGQASWLWDRIILTRMHNDVIKVSVGFTTIYTRMH